MKKITDFIVEKRFLFYIAFLVLAVVSIFLIPKIAENYDFSKYLSSSTETKQGLTVMEDEFGALTSLSVMVKNVNKSNADNYRKKLSEIPGVSYTKLDYKEGSSSALFTLSISYGDNSEQAAAVAAKVRALLANEDYYISGAAVTAAKLKNNITKQMPIILLIAAIITAVVLLLTSRSWFEPLIFAIIIIVSIVINLGTNLIFGEISYITKSVSAILQLALAMDYSIMLLHKYQRRRDEGENAKDAVKAALKESFSPVSASALTTVAGLLALVFMSFKIGFDIGIVLAKGIIISMLAVFLLMPGLIITFNRPLEKLAHKKLNLGGKFLGKAAIKTKYVLPAVLLFVIAGACYLQTTNSYTFSNATSTEDSKVIAAEFGENSQLALLYPSTATEESVLGFINDMRYGEKGDVFLGAVCWDNFYITAEDIALQLGAEMDVSKIMALLGGDENGVPAKTAYSLMQQLGTDGLAAMEITLEQGNAIFGNAALCNLLFTQAGYPDGGKLGDILSGIKNIEMTPDLVAGMFALSPESAQTLLALFGYPEKSVTLETMVNGVLSIPILMLSLTPAQAEMLSFAGALLSLDLNELTGEIESALASVRNMFVGKEYNRLLLSLDIPIESAETWKYLELIKSYANEHFGKSNFFAGQMMSFYDISKAFDTDLLIINLITILAILLIIGISFRSFTIPVCLVLVIQGAIWITLAFSALINQPIFFMSYIICICIQMGATIDYGILLSSLYVSNRKTMGKNESLIKATESALPTILTSGIILTAAGFIIGIVSTVMPVSSIGMLLGRGTLISVLMILFLLPPLLLLFDKLLIRKKSRYEGK